MAQLMLHRDLLKNFGKLPVQVQKRLAGFIDQFRINPNDPAIHLHSLAGSMLDPKVRGADLPNGYRAIVIAPEKGDTYIMVYIDKHDEAYAWAKNKRFEVHRLTGIFQIFDAETVSAVAAERSPIPPKDDYPLAKLSEEDLFQAGVPRPLIPAVRVVTSDAGLDALVDYLPPDCRDVLHGIAAGMSLEEALKEMLGMAPSKDSKPKIDGPGDFSDIGSRPTYDLVFVAGEEDLKKILQASLEEWRVFLHPYQRKLVEWHTDGPMNITGAAGTGKTVALIHRAVFLAQHAKQSERILLTTFTTNLSVTLKEFIRKLDPSATDRVEVTNLHSLARTICSRAGWKGRIAQEEELADIWEEVWLAFPDQLPMTKDELVEEYNSIIDPNGIDDEDAYLTAVRSGRNRISRLQRKQAWPVFLGFQRGLKRRDLMTFEGAVHQARLAVEQGAVPRYAHVLVDEAQDFSLEALRLIRSLSPGKEDGSDPLCLAGDGHQRIYRAKFPMSRAGIDIRGRSKRLKVNYRTSEQIRAYAQAMLQGLEIDDFEGGVTTTVADRSVFKGPAPDIVRCKNALDEAKAIVSWVKNLLEKSGMASHEICVTPFKASIMEALNSGGIATYQLRPREADPGSDEPGIRLGSMKRIKGLEFRAIAMACSDKQDPINNMAESEPLSRCERYVAATRARERLLITIAAV